jgi:hypothetical protein
MNNLSENHKTKLKLMKKSLLFSIIYSLLVSCSSSFPITSSLNPREVKSIALIPSLSNIMVLGTRNEEEIRGLESNDEVRANSDEAVASFFKTIEIPVEKLNLNDEDRSIIYREVASFCHKLDGKDKSNKDRDSANFNYQLNRDIFSRIQISEEIVDILTENKTRFAIVTVTVGYTRTQKGERNKILQNSGNALIGVGAYGLTGIGVFSMGKIYNTTTYFFLIDAEKQNLSMYSRKYQDNDPLKKDLLQKQIDSGLRDYWFDYSGKVNKK